MPHLTCIQAVNAGVPAHPQRTPQVEAGKLRLILLKGRLGECVVTGDFDASKLEETLHHFVSEKA